jgi:hypothetical protein
MPDALTDLAEPQMGKTPTSPSASIPAREVQDAVRKVFAFEGDLRVRYLWSRDGIGRYRANWFRPVEGEVRVVRSLFLCIERTHDGLVVHNETAGSGSGR